MESELGNFKITLSQIQYQIEPYFSRTESHQAASSYIEGLLSKIDRKNSWQLAEGTGAFSPYKFQNLLNRASWNEDSVRDYTQSIVINELGRKGTLVIDDTGFLKKGKMSVGVNRQYTGTAGRVENSQVGVFVSWKTNKGHALIDRELYIPEEWFKDRDRCEKAGIPEAQTFMTKNELAIKMYERVRRNGHNPAWVTADEAYGRDIKFRNDLESVDQSYVLAIGKDHMVQNDLLRLNVDTWFNKIKDRKWHRLSCGKGSKGERLYDWYLFKRTEPCMKGFERHILIRRNIEKPEEVAYYTTFAPVGTTLQELINVAGERWSIEECFETAKGETGLDQYEVRTFRGWYRHITLSMLAFSVLVISKSRVLSAPIQEGTMEIFKKKRKSSST